MLCMRVQLVEYQWLSSSQDAQCQMSCAVPQMSCAVHTGALPVSPVAYLVCPTYFQQSGQADTRLQLGNL